MKKINGALLTRQQHTPGGLQVRESENGGSSRTITGYAILFNTPSAVLWEDEGEEAREVIDPGAVSVDLLDGCDIKMTMFHDRQLILARSKEGAGTLSYGIDDRGVYFEFDAPKTVDGDKALELVKRGDISGCSFMFSTYYFDSDHVERVEETKGGKKCITYRVKKITGVYDFTLAADPAYPDTNCELREALQNATAVANPSGTDPYPALPDSPNPSGSTTHLPYLGNRGGIENPIKAGEQLEESVSHRGQSETESHRGQLKEMRERAKEKIF